jgi:hypothetical protein
MKVTQQVEVGRITHCWVSYDGTMEISNSRGDEVTFSADAEVMRTLAERINIYLHDEELKLVKEKTKNEASDTDS